MSVAAIQGTKSLVTNPGTPIVLVPNGQVYQSKKNWWKIGLAALAGFIAGGPVGAIVGGVTQYLAQRPIDIGQLLPGEYDAIISWFKGDFTAYFNTLIVEGNGILANNFSQASIPALNELQNKLCVLSNYYANVVSESSLSPAAVALRYQLISPLITAVENLLLEKSRGLGATTINASVDVGRYNMRPLFQTQFGTITCTNYYIPGKGNIPKVTVQTIPQTSTTTGSTTNSASKNTRLFLWGTATVALLAIAFSGGKNHSKNN